MNAYRYRITVEALEGEQTSTGLGHPLQFEVQNHDDIFEIAARTKDKQFLSPDDSAALVIGLKLFAEVALQNRKHPLFEPILLPIREFIQRLKALGASTPNS